MEESKNCPSIQLSAGQSTWIDPMIDEALQCEDKSESSKESIHHYIVEEEFFTGMDSENDTISHEKTHVRLPHRENANANGGKGVKRNHIVKTSKSKLFEICTENKWRPPIFTLLKEEGPSHGGRFTYKVVVEICTIRTTTFECFSEAKMQKKAAQEHCAEGALWFLKHLGHT